MNLRIMTDTKWFIEPDETIDSSASAAEIIEKYKEMNGSTISPSAIYMSPLGKRRGVFDLCVSAGLPMLAIRTITKEDIKTS